MLDTTRLRRYDTHITNNNTGVNMNKQAYIIKDWTNDMTHTDYQALLAKKDLYLDMLESAQAFNDKAVATRARTQLMQIAKQLSETK